MKNKMLILILSAYCVVSGCGLSINSRRSENPVIQDYAVSSIFGKSTNVFATKASHRLALISDKGNGKIVTCAEPSPDVGETFATAIAESFKGEATGQGGVKESLSGDSKRATATQIAPLLYRTQGLQLYRNAISSLCIDLLNDGQDDGHNVSVPIETSVKHEVSYDSATNLKTNIEATYDPEKRMVLNTGNYADLRFLYFMKAVEAIKAEIPLMLEVQKTFFEHVKSGIDIETFRKVAEIVNPSAIAEPTAKTIAGKEGETEKTVDQ